MGIEPLMAFLKRMGSDVQFVDAGCCGMAGSFGYEQEHFDISLQMAERRLLPAVRTLLWTPSSSRPALRADIKSRTLPGDMRTTQPRSRRGRRARVMALVLDIETVGQSIDAVPERALDYLFRGLERDSPEPEELEKRREDLVSRFGSTRHGACDRDRARGHGQRSRACFLGGG